jgi:hypothetical protein
LERARASGKSMWRAHSVKPLYLHYINVAIIWHTNEGNY